LFLGKLHSKVRLVLTTFWLRQKAQPHDSDLDVLLILLFFAKKLTPLAHRKRSPSRIPKSHLPSSVKMNFADHATSVQ
jgi:hypothetical protein